MYLKNVIVSVTGSNATSTNDAFGQMLSGPPPAQQQQQPPSSSSPDFGDFLGTSAPTLPTTTQLIQQQQQPLLQALPTQILQPQPSANLMQLNQPTVTVQQVSSQQLNCGHWVCHCLVCKISTSLVVRIVVWCIISYLIVNVLFVPV